MKKILAVDDHEDILNIIRAKLSKNNFDIQTLSDSTAVLHRIEEFQPDLVILDIMMPKITGFEICAAIRKSNINPQPIIVFLTAKDMDFTRNKAAEVGADGFIPKPFSPQELLENVQKLLVNR